MWCLSSWNYQRKTGPNKVTACAACGVTTMFYNYKKTSCHSNCHIDPAPPRDADKLPALWSERHGENLVLWGIQLSLGRWSQTHSKSPQPGLGCTVQSDRPGCKCWLQISLAVWPLDQSPHLQDPISSFVKRGTSAPFGGCGIDYVCMCLAEGLYIYQAAPINPFTVNK